MDRKRNLEDVGYIGDNKYSKKYIANNVRKRKAIGDIPPIYPNGWFAILESRDLKVKEVKSVHCLGLSLAVFRAENGIAHVLDAYCPHLGANLSVGGKVFGDCLECPFHGWRFRGDDGKCMDIPVVEKIPDIANIKSYISKEINGFIHIWHHAENVEPYWAIPDIENISDGRWVYRGRTEHHINCHIQEIPENGADMAHLAHVHEPLLMAGVDLTKMWSKVWQFAQHKWTAEWTYDKEQPHVGVTDLESKLKLWGSDTHFMIMGVSAKQIGPAIVYLEISTPLGKGAYIQTIVPIEPLIQKVVHHIYYEKYALPIVPKFFLFAEALMFERDIMVWNNKSYLKNPVYVKCKEDQLLLKHRRWFNQFYSENSPRLNFRKETLDW